MKILKYITFAAVLFTFYTSAQAETKPSSKSLEQEIIWNLPGHVELKEFTLDASQNLGNEIDPLWGFRFHASVSIKTDLFDKLSSDDNVAFVRLVTKEGKKLEIYGKIYSKMYQGKWQNKIEIDGNAVLNLGIPKNQISGERIIVRGSEEEQQYYASIPTLIFEEVVTLKNGGVKIVDLEPGYKYVISARGRFDIDDPQTSKKGDYTTIACHDGEQPYRYGHPYDKAVGKLPYNSPIFGIGVFTIDGKEYPSSFKFIPNKPQTLVFDANIPHTDAYYNNSKNKSCKITIKRGKVF